MNILVFLTAGFVILFLFTAYLIIKIPGQYKLKWFIIPLIAAFGIFMYTKTPTLLGAARMAYPAKKFELIDYGVFVLKNNNKVIEAWVIQDGDDDTRLFEMPFSESLKANLGALAAAQKKGSGVKGQFQGKPGDGKPGNSNALGNDPHLQIYNIPVEQLPAKPSDSDDPDDQ